MKRLWRPRLWCVLLSLALAPILLSEAVAAPTIMIASLPHYGASGFMCGTVSGVVDPSQYQVSSFLYVPGLGWYRKPYDIAPTVSINSDGTWCADVSTSGPAGLDSVATIFGAWLVASDYTVPPSPTGNYRVPPQLDAFPHDIKERYGPDYTVRQSHMGGKGCAATGRAGFRGESELLLHARFRRLGGCGGPALVDAPARRALVGYGGDPGR